MKNKLKFLLICLTILINLVVLGQTTTYTLTPSHGTFNCSNGSYFQGTFFMIEPGQYGATDYSINFQADKGCSGSGATFSGGSYYIREGSVNGTNIKTGSIDAGVNSFGADLTAAIVVPYTSFTTGTKNYYIVLIVDGTTYSVGPFSITATTSGGACSYSINPTSKSFTTSSGSGSIAVNTTPGCAWTATETAPWISITSGSSGTGSGTCVYSVTANTGSARSATITIAGESYSVTQAGVGGGSAPAAPTNVSATAISSSEISVSWNSSSGADEYEIYNSANSLLFTTASTSKNFTGLSSETNYCYKVKACNTDGCSGFSTIDCATTSSNCFTIGGLKTCDNQSLFPSSQTCSPNLRFSNAFSIGGSTISGNGQIYLNNYNGSQLPLYTGASSYNLNVSGTTFTTPTIIGINNFSDFAGLNIKLNNINVMCDGVVAQGNFSLPKLKLGGGTSLSASFSSLYLTTGGLNLAGSINASNIGVPGVFLLKSLDITYDTYQHDLDGDAEFETRLVDLGVGIGIYSGRLNRVAFSISGNNVGIPLGATGLQLTSGSGEVNNLSNGKNLEISLGVGISPVGLDVLAGINVNGKFNTGGVYSAIGTLNIMSSPLAQLGFEVKPNDYKFWGRFNFPSNIPIIEGYGSFNITKPSYVKIQAILGVTVRYPEVSDVNPEGFRETYSALMWACNKNPGDIIAQSKNYFTNTNSSPVKAYLAGYVRVNYWLINTIYYKFDWKGGLNYDISLGTNMNTIPTVAYNALQGSKSNSQTQMLFSINNFENNVIINAYKENSTPLFEIILPSGDTINSTNYNIHNYIEYVEAPQFGYAAFGIINPIFGDYIINIIDADSCQVLGAIPAPFATFSTIVDNAGAKTMNINTEFSSIADDATYMLGYTPDKDNLEGYIIAEGISVSEGINTYNWDYSGIESGEYYIYALVSNSKGMYSVVFSETKYSLIKNGAPNAPTNLVVSNTGSSVLLTWNQNNVAGTNYLLYFNDKQGTIDYSSNRHCVGDTNRFELNSLIPGRYYEFMVTAVNSNWDESNRSNIASVVYTSTIENNPPFIPKQNLPEKGYLGQPISYNLIALDNDGDPISYSIADGPAGMTINGSGLINWTPTTYQTGYNFVKIVVSDNSNAKDSVLFSIPIFDDFGATAWLSFNKPIYQTYADKGAITVEDPDYNTDPDVKDVVQIRLFSNSDMAGITINATETSPNSNIFNNIFNFTSGSSSGNTLNAQYGDTIWAEYQDANPAITVHEFAYFVDFQADFEYNSCVGDTVYFRNTSIGTGLTYLWSFGDGQTSTLRNPVIVYATHGDFNVSLTITSATGLISTITETINLTIPMQFAATQSSDVTCFGQNDAYASVNVIGGTPPYSYEWNSTPPQTSYSAIMLGAGNYNLTITDSKNCKKVYTKEVLEPEQIAISVNSAQNVSCYGLSDGSLDISSTGGTGAYSYSWDTEPQQLVSSISDLSAGYYTVTVTDANGCEKTFSKAISQPSPLSSNLIMFADITCFGANNGEISVAASGGTSPYSYIWNTSPQQTTEIATNLEPGIHTVTITDINNCQHTFSQMISEPSPLYVNESFHTDVSCNGMSDAQSLIIANGGTPPYSYLWNTNPQQTSANANGLGSGTYIVTVTDQFGCNQTLSIEFFEPQLLTAVLNHASDLTCFGANDGYITANINGGTAPYIYNWDADPVQNTASATMLEPGIYNLTVTDSRGCSATLTQEIGSPDEMISVLANVIEPSCFGLYNGVVSLNSSGGVPPYSYIWNTIPAQITETAENLPAGNYLVTTTDSNNCEIVNTVYLNEPDILISSLQKVDVSCFGYNDGKIAVTTSGGSPEYSYSWNEGQDTPVAELLTQGNYQVTVTDANNCQNILQATIVEPAKLEIEAINDTIICKEDYYELNLSVNGGTQPYYYNWWCSSSECNFNASGIIDPIVTPLVSTKYYSKVTDANSCESNLDSVNVNIVPDIVIHIERDTCIFEGESIQLFTTSNQSITYDWMPSISVDDPSAANPYVNPVETTEFVLTATNSYGCRAQDFVEIIVYRNLKIPTAFTPNNDGVNDTWDIDNIIDYPNCEIEIYDRFNNLVFKSNGYSQAWNGTAWDKELPIGSYFYIIDVQRGKNVLKGTVSIIK